MATVEFFKLAGILSAALSQHNLLGFEIAQLEFPLQSPRALFVVMLPKAHLILYSRMSGSGKSQFSFQSQRKAMPKNAQTTAQLHSSHTLAK